MAPESETASLAVPLSVFIRQLSKAKCFSEGHFWGKVE
jgi:hypothetical protein